MKKLMYLATTLLVLVACKEEAPTGYDLSISINVEDGKEVLLKKEGDANTPITIDTAYVKEGKISFVGDIELPEMHYLFIEGIRGNLPVILEKGTILIEADKDSLMYAKSSGTKSNEEYAVFVDEMKKLASSIPSIRKELNEAGRAKDTAKVAELRTKFLEAQEAAKNYQKDFVKEHPDAYLSGLLLRQMAASKMIPKEEVKELYNAFSEEVKKTKMAEKVAKMINEVDPLAVGAIAPDFMGKTPEGKVLTLNDVKGKVTVIDFWASWCKPCRVENPNVVKMYNKLHDKGLNIVGVSLDKDGDKWKEAIEKDGLTWSHVSNLQFWQDPIARLYKVNSIPHTVVLDANGTIVAKNLRGQALEAKVEALLAN